MRRNSTKAELKVKEDALKESKRIGEEGKNALRKREAEEHAARLKAQAAEGKRAAQEAKQESGTAKDAKRAKKEQQKQLRNEKRAAIEPKPTAAPTPFKTNTAAEKAQRKKYKELRAKLVKEAESRQKKA